MVNPLELTYYARTGYNPSDEPISDAVIDLNEHWTASLPLKEYDPSSLQEIKVKLSDDDLHRVDYLKIRDTVTNERWYYYVVEHKRYNENVVALRIVMDSFATVGINNISFFGNVTRRSLSASERTNYPLLPEPWAPRRPLKTRRIIIDLNVNKTIKTPSHISTEFSEEETKISDTETIQVPTTPLGITTTPDSLSFNAVVPMGYPNAAGDTSHTISTPWGTIQYTTPYEQYLTLSGTALTTFLAKAKKYNAIDLIEPPYYVPNPGATKNVTISELSNPNTRNPKASRYYTTITIRSLASNSAQTYSDQNTDLQYNQSLTIVIAPDKNGGIYVIPTTLRDTGLSAYTYLDGVYSPFETVVYNAIGDTPAKFAADGTTILNTAYNNLFQTYINKVNALQVQGMQAKYFKDIGTVKGAVLAFSPEVLGVTSETITTIDSYTQRTTGDTKTAAYSTKMNQHQSITGRSDFYNLKGDNAGGSTGTVNIGGNSISTTGSNDTAAQSSSSTSNTVIPKQVNKSVTTQQESNRSVEDGNKIAVGGVDKVYELDTWNTLRNILFGSYQNEMHSFMLGNINDYLNRWVSIQNDMHNGKVANLFKNITLLGNYGDFNKLVGKYEILVSSLQPEDEANFDLFLDHFGHAVDEYTNKLVADVRDNYNYTMVGEDAILSNNMHQDANGKILNQFRTGVRVWKTLIRPENY